MTSENIPSLLTPANTKIVMLVMDGLGGLPMPGGKTELETAKTRIWIVWQPKGCSNQYHRLWDYPRFRPRAFVAVWSDPVAHEVGRGVLEAMGVGMFVHTGEVRAIFSRSTKMV